MNVLVTGHRGFVGKATLEKIREDGHTFTGYDIMDGNDIRDRVKLYELVKSCRPDRILHLAAVARFADADRDPLQAFETNAYGTKNVVDIARLFRIPIVYASTGSVYMPIEQEPPITEDFPVRGNSVYGCSKAVGEKYVMNAGVPWIILRYGHLYGKEKRHHGLIGGFLTRIQRGAAPILYGGKQSNDFCYIKDVVRANLLALSAEWDSWNQAYNIGTGEEMTAEKAGKIICEAANYKGKIEKRKGRTVDPGRFVYDCRKATSMLGFTAEFSFREGLKDMFK